MHFNREKISGPKLKISPRGRKNKTPKKTSKKDIKPIARSKIKKRNNLKITKSALSKNIDDTKKYRSLLKWAGILEGHTAFILGNSPSISNENLGLLDSYFTIGVNRIFYLYDPTILMWQDKQLWNTDKKNILKQKAIRICSNTSDPKNIFLNFKVADGPFKFRGNPQLLHGKGNTGVLAIQLAVVLGCSNIVLIGTDCKYGPGRKTDFYGKNKDHKSYTLKMCRTAMKWAKKNCPVPIYNCSNNELWPKRKLQEVIREIRPPKTSRQQYMELFKR